MSFHLQHITFLHYKNKQELTQPPAIESTNLLVCIRVLSLLPFQVCHCKTFPRSTLASSYCSICFDFTVWLSELCRFTFYVLSVVTLQSLKFDFGYSTTLELLSPSWWLNPVATSLFLLVSWYWSHMATTS